MPPKSTIHRFGPYEFVPAQQELRVGDERKPLSKSMNTLLVLLLSQPGEIVTREQIADALWDEHGTVDITAGINTAINRLRTVIGDNNGHGTFIETVVGAGYRFIAPVSQISAAEDDSALQAASVHAGGTPAAKRVWLKFLVAAAVLLLVAGIGWSVYSSRHLAHTVALASFVVDNMHPVTSDEAEDKLTAAAISPTGKFVASADVHGLTIQNTSTGEPRVINLPDGFDVERIAWFSDESSVLVSAHVRLSSGPDAPQTGEKAQAWILSADGTSFHIVLDDAAFATPSPDGQHLAFLRTSKTEIWTSGSDGNSAHKLAQTQNGETFSTLLWSLHGEQILTDHQSSQLLYLPRADVAQTGTSPQPKNHDEKQAAYESYDARSGALLAHHDDIAFDSAVLLPDGRLLYANNKGDEQTRLAVVAIDARTGAPLGDPVPAASQNVFKNSAARAVSLSATADGKTLAAVLDMTDVNVYTADLVDGQTLTPSLKNIVRLSKRSYGNFPTSWTPDGTAVVFDVNSQSGLSIGSQTSADASPRILAQPKQNTNDFAQARFSSDGRWLLYLHSDTKTDNILSIDRQPATGGNPTAVPTTGKIENFRCSISPAGRCVLREIEDKKQFVYYELDPVRGMGRELARIPWQPNIRGDWSVSPDGKVIAVANHDPSHTSIQLIALPSGNDATVTTLLAKEIPVAGFGVVLSPAWARDGQKIFVESFTGSEYDLLYLDMQGHVTLLRQAPDLVWAVPSPDGSKIAFPADTPSNHNAWVGTLHFSSPS